jgi:predicted MFS family arabinose efflux permease
VLVGAGLLLMHGVTADSDWTTLLGGFVLAGAGIGMINPSLATTAIGVVAPQRSGMASGINNTFRQVGIATGIAALGALFQSRIDDKVSAGLHGTPGAAHASDIAHGVASGGVHQVLTAVPPQARETVARVANDAFASGLNELFTVCAVVAFAGAVLAAIMVRQRDFVPQHGPEAAPAAA